MLDKLAKLLPDTINLDVYGAFILMMGLLFFYMLYKANKQGHLIWTDFITYKGSNRVSLTKFLQLVGGIVGTWVVIQLTLKGMLTSDYLIMYLTYVGAIEGWSKFVSAKYNAQSGSNGYGNGYGNGNGRYGGYQRPNNYNPNQSQHQPQVDPTANSSGVDDVDLDAALPPKK